MKTGKLCVGMLLLLIIAGKGFSLFEKPFTFEIEDPSTIKVYDSNDPSKFVEYPFADGSKTAEYVMASLVAANHGNGEFIKVTPGVAEGLPYIKFRNRDVTSGIQQSKYSVGFRKQTDAANNILGDEVLVWHKDAFDDQIVYTLQLPKDALPWQILKFDYIVAQIIKIVFPDNDYAGLTNTFTITITPTIGFPQSAFFDIHQGQ